MEIYDLIAVRYTCLFNPDMEGPTSVLGHASHWSIFHSTKTDNKMTSFKTAPNYDDEPYNDHSQLWSDETMNSNESIIGCKEFLNDEDKVGYLIHPRY